MREAPENQLPSLEELRGRIEKIYGLLHAQRAARWTVDISTFTHTKPYPHEEEERVEYGVSDKAATRERWEALRQIPEFRDFIAEEENMFAGGVSGEEAKQYSTLYRRAYEKRMEIDEQLSKLKQDYPVAYEIAQRLHVDNLGKPWSAVDALEVAAAYKGVQEDEERSAERSEYVDAIYRLNDAAEGMRAKELLAAHEKMAKERGFGSAEEMYAAYVDNVKQFKARVGAVRFGEFTSGVNSRYWGEEKKLVEGEENN